MKTTDDLKFLAALGLRIKATRKLRHLSQSQLAILCDIEKGSFSRIEAGKINITILTIHTIARALKVSVSSLCEGESHKMSVHDLEPAMHEVI